MNSTNNTFEAEAMADQEHEVMKLWRACRSDLEGLTQRTAGSFLRSIKFRILDRIIGAAGKNARLSGYDDILFECVKKLMGFYSSAIEYFELHSAELNTFSIKNLILDVYKVLNEQLRLFRAQSPSKDENPVAVERIKLLSAGVAFFLLSFKDSEDFYRYDRVRASELAGQFTPEYFDSFIDDIQNDIIESFVENNYPAYKKAVLACMSGLNSLQERKTLLYYYTLLSDETDALTFIARQTSEIKHELFRNAGNSVESDIVRGFLTIIGEAQSFYYTECQKLMAYFRATEDAAVIQPESAEALCSAFGYMLANNRLIAKKDYSETRIKYDADIQLLKSRLEDNTELFTAPISARMNIKALMQETLRETDETALNAKEAAETIACLFARQVSYYRENTDNFFALAENDIIKGINETLMIKAEILAESISAFGEKRFYLTGSDLELTSKEREQLIGELFQILRLGFLHEDDNGDDLLGKFYDDAVYTETIAAYRKRVTEICQREKEGAAKAAKSFFKDSVLFEISTFEEILQYSVTRLRESDNDYVKDYVDMIDENARKIENTLDKAGITMIRPNPHDNFNGREHEILMAEHMEGFAKGETIKTMTSGYRLNGQILIRANIIAAK